MKYKIELSGYGNSISVGHLKSDIKSEILSRVSGGEDISDFIKEYNIKSDVYQNSNVNEEFVITITDSDGETYNYNSLDLFDDDDETIKYEYLKLKKIDEDLILCTSVRENRNFFVGEIEDGLFDLSKLKITMMGNIEIGDFFFDDMVSKIKYKGSVVKNNSKVLSLKSSIVDVFMNV